MIKPVLLVLYNILRFQIGRLFFLQNMDIHYIQRISPSCTVKLFNHGRLKIGRNCELEAGCDLQVHGEGVLTIGNGVYMNRYCMVSAHGSVEIGDGCFFGPGVRIFDNNHRFDANDGVSSKLSIGTIRIGHTCWIASNVVLLKGADIGDNCVIGAGCIVNGKIPSGSIVRPNVTNIIEEIKK